MSRQSVIVRPFVMMCWIIAAGPLAVSCNEGAQIGDKPIKSSEPKGNAGRNAASGRGGAGAAAAADKAGSGGAGRMGTDNPAGKEAGPGAGEDAGMPDEQDGGMDSAGGAGGAGGSGSGGKGGMEAGQGGVGGAGGSKSSEACKSCQGKDHGGANLCPATVKSCQSMPGNTSADSPIRPNTPNGALCQEIVECMEAMGCAKTAATDCLCGAGVNPNTCFGGSYADMKGPCKELIAAGTETMNPVDLAMRFSDEEYPMGRVVQVIEMCDQLFCLDECL